MEDTYIKRCGKFIRNRIAEYHLDLSDLTVCTELGSRNYAFTCVIAALANAKKVYAITRSSRYGTREENCNTLKKITNLLNIGDKIKVVEQKNKDFLQEVDILTNSGCVRPIDKETIDYLKPTAVIPLMWETWEFRKEEIDIDSAKQKGILIFIHNIP